MPEKKYKIGDRVKVSLPLGRIVDATIRAVIDRTDGVHFQVDFGHEQTALIHEKQVVELIR